MRLFQNVLSYALVTLLSPALFAAEFQMMKPGEWTSEVVESSMGPAAKFIKPQTLCIDEKDTKRDWEAVLKEEFKKSQLDCKLEKLKQDAAAVSFRIDCKGTEASKGSKNALPPDATYQGTIHMTRESDTAYLLDSDSKVSGLKLSDADLGKIPAEQRKALQAVLALQAGDMKVKMKQRYTFVKAACVKKADAKASPSTPSTPATPAAAPAKK